MVTLWRAAKWIRINKFTLKNYTQTYTYLAHTNLHRNTHNTQTNLNRNTHNKFTQKTNLLIHQNKNALKQVFLALMDVKFMHIPNGLTLLLINIIYVKVWTLLILTSSFLSLDPCSISNTSGYAP